MTISFEDMPITFCDGCGEIKDAGHVNTNLIEGGWSLDITSFGYYEGYTDEFEEKRRFKMCKDCIEKLLDLFPNMKNWL